MTKGDLSMANLRFATYTHKLVIKGGRIISRNYIVLKDLDTKIIVKFTNFDRYVYGGKNKIAKNISENGNRRHVYVVKFLNYLFFDSGWKIKKLSELTIDMVSDYLLAYGMGDLCENDNLRTEETINKCVSTIIDFISALTQDIKCKLKPEQLYREQEYRTKKGHIKTRRVPAFEVRYIHKDTQIMRDIPDKVFAILMDQIRRQHPDILMLVACSAFGGLRPSETLNLRRRDSLLGPGIKITLYGGEIIDIKLDLTKEVNLRSDLVTTGGIKKERTAKIYPAFLNSFYELYQEYMHYLNEKKYEEPYGPLSINSKGMAMTYKDYYNRFRTAVHEIIPTCLDSCDPEVVQYGMLLQEHNLSPHALRHWFTVKLVLFGVDIAGLMFYRGDTNPESSLRYLNNKSELEKQYQKINNELFDYRTWQAQKIIGRYNNDGI